VNVIPRGRAIHLAQDIPGSLMVRLMGGDGDGSLQVARSNDLPSVIIQVTSDGHEFRARVSKRGIGGTRADLIAESIDAPAVKIAFNSVGEMEILFRPEAGRCGVSFAHTSRGGVRVRIPATFIDSVALDLTGGVPFFSRVENEFGLSQASRRSLVRTVSDPHFTINGKINIGAITLSPL
jgi:hypothetical protein